ncbi:hypothetical protein [Hymenobacter chitinivorans]|uniref:hypothetical protein n=1 Tax=Hymenobacter chitinivorans TaxID=89969 RepID=UPI0012FE08B4|nr:hypothetical protein [Hymenobacter chitinivorans]
MENCTAELVSASYCLTYFDAPVLSNYYLDADIYRFLWLRSFHRPVLLTLRQDAHGATLRTQLLDKYPGFHTLTVFHPDQLAADATPQQRARAQKFYEETMADSAFQAQVAEAKRRARQVVAEETTSRLTAQQVQAFQNLLTQAQFWQLPSCQPAFVLDGAQWLLEAHQANAYHMVSRKSPDEGDKFRRACEYLIELSSVRAEERY